MEIVNIIAAAGFVLFLPGFAISFIFFAKGKIDLIERIALSLALSIAVVPLVTFYTNLLGIPITKLSVAIQICSLLVLTSTIIVIKHEMLRNKKDIQLQPPETISAVHAHTVQKTSPNKFISAFHVISDELFKTSLVTYLLLLIMETISEGFVTYFFNPTVLLYIVTASGVGMTLTQHTTQEIRKENEANKVNWFYIFCMGFLGSALVYIKTKELGNISLIITVATFALIVLVSYLISTERE